MHANTIESMKWVGNFVFVYIRIFLYKYMKFLKIAWLNKTQQYR